MDAETRRRIEGGRTDLLVPWADTLSAGERAWALAWCLYFGDVSALRCLLRAGARLDFLDQELLTAAFHGHWRLVQFLLEEGAPVDAVQPRTRETALHLAVCGPDPSAADRVVQVLLAAGADPNACCAVAVPTHSLMRDARTRGETVLHRAAAFANLASVERLLQAGADPLSRDAHGDTPLAWASWARRPVDLLRALLHEGVEIHPDYRPLRENLLGDPT